eukprot:TRINITY_DN3897_c0_g1_i1.p1 TRINITY_DN3897_c0_g1~~TRINITY_DN3897_c0_g1_i1.p1  ORF type:complete len:471 (+),score=135.89 TRINITY_DN3897_c0_g1_i1:181-1593(+)
MADLFGSVRERVIFSLFCAVAVPIYLGMVLVFYLRRNRQPIKARSPLLLICSALAGFLLLVYMALRTVISDLIPCPTTYYVAIFFFILYFIPWLMRCYRLYRVFDFNVAKSNMFSMPLLSTTVSSYSSSSSSSTAPMTLKGRNEDEEHSPSKDEFQRIIDKRATLTEMYMLRLLFIIMIAVAVILGALHAGLSTTHLATGTAGCNITERWTVLAVSALVVLMVIVFIFLVFKMKYVSDAFSINNELKLVCLIATLFVTVNLVLMSLDDYAWPKTPYIGYITGSLVICGLLISVGWPLWRSFFPKKGGDDMQLKQLGDDTFTLPPRNPDFFVFVEFLKDPEARRSFQEFLVNEFSVENILFWQDVQTFRLSGDNPADLQRISDELVSKYVNNGSPMQINVSSTTNTAIKRVVSGDTPVSVTMFDNAENEIIHLMKNDSYPRFLDSSQAQRLLREKQKRARTLKAASAANLV